MDRLYEISSEIEAVIEANVDLETGELSEGVMDQLDALEVSRSDRLLDLARYAKDEEVEEKAIRAVVADLEKRARGCAGRARRAKSYIDYHMRDGESLKAADIKVRIGGKDGVRIDSLADIPPRFFKAPKEDWVAKKAIKDAIDKGEEVPGAHVGRGTFVVIS